MVHRLAQKSCDIWHNIKKEIKTLQLSNKNKIRKRKRKMAKFQRDMVICLTFLQVVTLMARNLLLYRSVNY